MKRVSALLIFALLFSTLSYSQALVRDSLIADFDLMVTYLEQTHPDPYSGFGGKVAFRQKAGQLRENLSQNDYDADSFCDLLTGFLANMHDGHTFVRSQNAVATQQNEEVIPVSFTVIPDDIVVTGVRKGDEQYLGARLLSIEGVPLNTILESSSKYRTAENRYGEYLNVSYFGRGRSYLEKWLGKKLGDEATLEVKKTDGKVCSWKLGFLKDRPADFYDVEGYKPLIPIKNNGFGFADRDHKVMVFISRSIMARENYEFCVRNGWDGSMDDVVNYYKNARKPMPTDTTEALRGIPSFSESFLEMLNQMKDNNTETLIVDLRGNGGGWTPITLPTLYMMYGDKFFAENDYGADCRVLSPLYLEKINMTLEQYNIQYHSSYKLGDYLFGSEGSEFNPDQAVKVRKDFIDGCMSATKDALRAQNGKPIYTPKNVYVITDPYTFSAAFHYTFYLSNMGAKVAGVTSRQAPNTFMETTPFTLPYSHIYGSISNYMQILLPTDNPRAKSFTPDIEMSYNQYKSYKFNQDAIIMYLIESTGAKIVK